MNILGLICVRGGSKGVRGKNAKSLHGKPLMQYTIDAARQCKLIDDLIISTDSDQLATIAKDLGLEVPFMRPEKLSSDNASKWGVFIHALEEYESITGKKYDVIVDLDVTVPLKTSEDIDGAIQLLLANPACDVVITGYEPERNPYFNMMEETEGGFVSMVKKTKTPIVRRQDAPKVYSLSPAAYVVRRDALYNYEHWSKAKCMIYEIPRGRAIDMDTEFEFQFVEYLLKEKYND